MKKILAVFISALFLFPSITQAATFEEQKQAIIFQLIHLIQQQIAYLQAEIARQDAAELAQAPAPANPLPDNTAQITELTHLFGSITATSTIPFDMYGAVQKSGNDAYLGFATNKPVQNISVSGGDIMQGTLDDRTDGKSNFRAGQPAYQYALHLENVDRAELFTVTIISTTGETITREYSY